MTRLVPFTFLAAAAAMAFFAVRSESTANNSAFEKRSAKPSKAAVTRARKTVKMMDDIYKTTVVLITSKYVNKETDFPAGAAAVALFDHVTKKGYHQVRLIDVTGKPYDPKNVAKNTFEKEGVKQLKAGKSYYEKIDTIKGKPYLRAITPIPVVLKKCIMCHPHYAKAKKGEAIGAIVYAMPIE